MFKEYSIAKLSIGILIFTVTIFEWNKGIENKGIFFTDRISYSNESKVLCKSDACEAVHVKSISGGFNFEGLINDFTLHNLKSNLYVVNNQFPLVIKSGVSSPVTVVFPFVNNLLYSESDGSLLVDSKSDTISLLNPSVVNDMDVNLFNLLSSLKCDYNVISDFDMDQVGTWNESKVLIIYGKSKFYSKKILDNLGVFVNNGGQLIIISSCFADYSFIYDEANSCVIKERNENGDLFTPIGGFSFVDSINNQTVVMSVMPFKDTYGGVAQSEQFEILNYSTGNLVLYSKDWSGYITDYKAGYFVPFGQMKVEGGQNEIAQSGMYKYAESAFGSIYFIGSESFLYDVNYERNEVKNFLELVFKKALSF